MTRDPRYLQGVAHFNNGDYFEAHEVWEDLWHATYDDSKNFIQGLIQVATAFHHFRHGNMRGARILHDSGIELLAPYGAAYMGLDLKTLREKFDTGLKEILAEPLERLVGRGHAGPVTVPFSADRAFKLEVKE
jgi:hypothetical protein